MFLRVLLCFAVPIVWAIYACAARKELVPYLFLFLCFSLFSALAASGVQAVTQPLFSKVVIFSGGLAALALHSFVQAGLIEEAFKAIFFFIALRRAFAGSRELNAIKESVAFYFAVFFGSSFASFETLGSILYIPGAAVTRMFTAHVLHPAAMLAAASAVFFGKTHVVGYIVPCIAAIAVHGFYNFTVGMRGLFGAVLYAGSLLVLVAALWAIIFSRVRASSGRGARSKKKGARNKTQVSRQ